MKFSAVSLVLTLSAAPEFVHGTNHHNFVCEYWPEICDDDHNHDEERRTLLDAEFGAVTAGTKKHPTRKLLKSSLPLPPRPVFCDDYKMYWNTTAWRETILIQGSPAPPTRYQDVRPTQ